MLQSYLPAAGTTKCDDDDDHLLIKNLTVCRQVRTGKYRPCWDCADMVNKNSGFSARSSLKK